MPRYLARSSTSALAAPVPVALAAATAKTVLAISTPANADPITVVEFGISFDGVTATAVPVTVELGIIGAAATVTAFTPVQVDFRPAAASASSAGYNASVEPTYLKIVRNWFVPPTSGLVVQFPLGREAGTNISTITGIAVRCTAPAIVNCLPYIEFEE